MTIAGWRFKAASFALPALLATACGARSSLLADAASTSSSTSSSGGGDGGAGASGSTGSFGGSGATGGGGGEPRCLSDQNPANWPTEEYRDDNDYERAVGAVSNENWLALKVKGGNVVLAIPSVSTSGIVLEQRIDVPSSDFPLALDVDARRLVMLTTSGINFNGSLVLWRVSRDGSSITHVDLGTLPDPSFNFAAAIAVAGDEIVVARGPAGGPSGVVEVYDDALVLQQSAPVQATSFTAIHVSDQQANVYCDFANTVIEVKSGDLIQTVPGDPEWLLRGGLEQISVAIGQHVAQFQITDGQQQWLAPWPHTQISPPTVVRRGGGRFAVMQVTELTAVVGHVYDDVFQWIPIDPSPMASGIGLGLLPLTDDNRLGLFYLGLEIPSPEQPLRYFGHICPGTR